MSLPSTDAARQETTVPARRPLAGWDGVRPALALWVGSRVALMLFVIVSAGLGGVRLLRWTEVPGQLLFSWDSNFFLRIADHGYAPPGNPCCDQAFFPGYPLAMRAVAPLVGGNLVVAGIVVSMLSGVVAAAMLWRIGTDLGGPRVGRLAVIYLAVAPYGIFLSAVYSESLFLALSLTAWWAGSRRRWWLSGLLAAAASGVRINGLFLAAALAVMYAVQLRAEGRWNPRPDALALLAPVAVTGAYFVHLARLTGSWNAWQEAQARGWNRRPAWPWEGVYLGWKEALRSASPSRVVSHWSELVTVVAGLVLLGALLVLRRYPEATYILLSVAALICSTRITSASRYALLWFPACLLLAQLSAQARWRWLQPVIVLGCLPLLGALAFSFASHQWVS
jgi:hypothetical protein